MALVKQYLFVPRNTIGEHQPKITNAMRGLTRRSKAIETMEGTIFICLLKLADTFFQHLTARCIYVNHSKTGKSGKLTEPR